MPAAPAAPGSAPASAPGAAALALRDEASPLLSEEAVRVIQALQGQLQRASWQLRDAEAAAARQRLAAEEQHSYHAETSGRHREVARKAQALEREHEEDLQQRRLLRDRLDVAQEELAEARARQARSVPGKDIAAAREELRRLRAQLAEAAEEGQTLRTRIAEAEEAACKRVRRTAARDADAERQHPCNAITARLSEAKQLSVRVAQDRKGKDSKLQAERASQLLEQKERWELEYQELYRRNVGLEQRMDALRGRNRQLEAQQRKQGAADEELEAKLNAELRGQAQQRKVLTELLRLPPETAGELCLDYELAESGAASTAASPTASASASTWASTSASQRLWSSTISLVPTRSTGAISEPGSAGAQAPEAAGPQPLSQVAALAVADQLAARGPAPALAAAAPCLPATAGLYGAGAAPSSPAREPPERAAAAPGGGGERPLDEQAHAADAEMRRQIAARLDACQGEAAPPRAARPGATSHLDAAISKTQSLLTEVQGWRDLAGDEAAASR